jgi:hypothetical protein
VSATKPHMIDYKGRVVDIMVTDSRMRYYLHPLTLRGANFLENHVLPGYIGTDPRNSATFCMDQREIDNWDALIAQASSAGVVMILQGTL